MQIREAHVEYDRVTFEFSYSPDLVKQVKELGQREYDSVNKIWTVFIDKHSLPKIVNFIINNAFLKSGENEELDALLKKRQQELENTFASAVLTYPEAKVNGLGGELRPFQKQAPSFVKEKKRVIIGDEQGLGKTIQALASIQYVQAYPLLIVTPPIVKYNWYNETVKWLQIRQPATDILVVEDKNIDKLRNSQHKVVIVSYALLDKLQDSLQAIEFKGVIIDEAHKYKNRAAKRTKALLRVCDLIPVRVALTGTLVSNRPAELVSVLEILDQLKQFGGWYPFVERYCGAFRSTFGLNVDGAANLKELYMRLSQTCYLRRNKSEVATEIPPKTRSVVTLDIDNRREYQKASQGFDDYYVEQVMEHPELLNRLAELSGEQLRLERQAVESEAFGRTEMAGGVMRLTTLQTLVAQGKQEAVGDWIENFLASGEKLVVFAMRKEMVNYLSKRFAAPKIDGSVPAARRTELVHKFQTDPTVLLMVLQVKAGSVGITLTAATNVAFAELPWDPADCEQGEDRVHRIGQLDAVNCYYLIARETVEEYVYRVLESKRLIMNRVNTGQVSWGEPPSTDT
jgi:SNF2 family DNA or RNA helicase